MKELEREVERVDTRCSRAVRVDAHRTGRRSQALASPLAKSLTRLRAGVLDGADGTEGREKVVAALRLSSTNSGGEGTPRTRITEAGRTRSAFGVKRGSRTLAPWTVRRGVAGGGPVKDAVEWARSGGEA